MFKTIIKILEKSFSAILIVIGFWTSGLYQDEKSSYVLLVLSTWILLDNILLPLANYIDEEKER